MSNVTIQVTLNQESAWQLAEVLKRCGFSDYRNHVRSDEEAYQAQEAAEAIRYALRQQGIDPR